VKQDNTHTNKTGFKVPDGYFEDFENKLSKKLLPESQEKSMLGEKVAQGFKVPENYFDTLSQELSQKLAPEKGKVVSIFTKRNLLYISGIAAMIAILISISIKTNTELNFDAIEIADIHTYFSEGNIELSDMEMASLLGENINYTETFGEESINEETLLEYLSNEDIDEEIIFAE